MMIVLFIMIPLVRSKGLVLIGNVEILTQQSANLSLATERVVSYDELGIVFFNIHLGRLSLMSEKTNNYGVYSIRKQKFNGILTLKRIYCQSYFPILFQVIKVTLFCYFNIYYFAAQL